MKLLPAFLLACASAQANPFAPMEWLAGGEAADRLAARIEGTMKGKERGIDFPMQRTACP